MVQRGKARDRDVNGEHGISSGTLPAVALILLFSVGVLVAPVTASDPGSLNDEGATFLAGSQYPEALSRFQEALALDPANTTARVGSGIALLNLQRFQDAVLAFDIALERDPEHAETWMYRGDALAGTGEMDEAADSYRQAVTLDPTLDTAWVKLGDSLASTGRWDEAIGAWRQGVALRPDDALLKDRIADAERAHGGIGLPLLVFSAACVCCGVAGAVFFLRKKNTKAPHVIEEEKTTGWKDLFPTNPSPAKKPHDSHRGTVIQTENHGSEFPLELENESPAVEPGSSHQGAHSEKTPGSPRLTGIKASFTNLFGKGDRTRDSNPDAESSPAQTPAESITSPGPLGMEGGEVFSANTNTADLDRDSSPEQIVAGFDRILSGMDHEPAGFRGIARYAMGRYTEALEEFDREIEQGNASIGIWTLKATALDHLGRIDEALASCEAVIKDGNGQFEIRKIQGNILEKLGRWEETLRASDEALSRNPHSVEVWSMRARALHALARNHEALQSCERALGMDPTSMDLLREKAVILADLGRVDDAISTLDQAISADHRETSLILEKGRILHRSGRPREALKEIDAALALSPDNHEAWSDLAKVLHTMEDPLEEAAAWERASALCPGNSEYLASWGDALQTGGEYLASAKVYLKGIEKSPRTISLWYGLGTSLYSAGKFTDSTKAFRFIIKESPKDGKAWKYLGCSLLALGKPEEALAAFRKAEPLIPGDPEIAEGIRRAKIASRGTIQEKNPFSPLEKPGNQQTHKNMDDDNIQLPRGRDVGEVSPRDLKQTKPPAEIPGVSSDPASGEGRDGFVKGQDWKVS